MGDPLRFRDDRGARRARGHARRVPRPDQCRLGAARGRRRRAPPRARVSTACGWSRSTSPSSATAAAISARADPARGGLHRRDQGDRRRAGRPGRSSCAAAASTASRPNVPFNDADVQAALDPLPVCLSGRRRRRRCRSGACAIRNCRMASRADRRHRHRAALHPGRRRRAQRALRRASTRRRCCASCSPRARSGDVAVVSSFGAESAVLLHLVAQADPTMPVIFLDTLKMFPETLAYRDDADRALRPDQFLGRRSPIRRCSPPRTRTACAGRGTPTAAARSARSSRCKRAKQGLDAWITGRKAFQSVTRAEPAALRDRGRPAQDQPARRLDQGRPRRLLRRARPAAPPARGARLPLDRLPALHQHGRAGRGPARGPLARLGQDRMRHPRARPAPGGDEGELPPGYEPAF